MAVKSFGLAPAWVDSTRSDSTRSDACTPHNARSHYTTPTHLHPSIHPIQAPRALEPGALAVVLGYQGGVAELVAAKLGGAYQVCLCLCVTFALRPSVLLCMCVL